MEILTVIGKQSVGLKFGFGFFRVSNHPREKLTRYSHACAAAVEYETKIGGFLGLSRDRATVRIYCSATVPLSRTRLPWQVASSVSFTVRTYVRNDLGFKLLTPFSFSNFPFLPKPACRPLARSGSGRKSKSTWP
jgi:hypothetical protein